MKLREEKYFNIKYKYSGYPEYIKVVADDIYNALEMWEAFLNANYKTYRDRVKVIEITSVGKIYVPTSSKLITSK